MESVIHQDAMKDHVYYDSVIIMLLRASNFELICCSCQIPLPIVSYEAMTNVSKIIKGLKATKIPEFSLLYKNYY